VCLADAAGKPLKSAGPVVSSPGADSASTCADPAACPPTLAGTASRAEIEETYAISRRIEAEERALDSAVMVFTSTQQEVDDQWGLYDG
jgi:hypothetical protein